MSILSFKNVTKLQGKETILNSLNFTVQKGEFLVIVGPSGCGKSTLLRLVAGLEELSAGEIYLEDKCITHLAPHKRDIAMVFQNYALYPHMTVYGNLEYGLKLRKVPKFTRESKIHEIAKLLRLSHLLQRKPLELSGGQKQRVAMGRAIVRDPAMFLFDEPLSNLDGKLRHEMRHEMQRLHKQLGITSLYVTHDHTEAMTLGERIIVLNNAALEQIGTPEEIYKKPATKFVAGFLSPYPMNFFDAVLNLQQKAIFIKDLGLTLPMPSKLQTLEENLEIAIRAENFVVNSTGSYVVKTKVEWIDNLGFDKLLRTRSIDGGIIYVRTTLELDCEDCKLGFQLKDLMIFSKETGHRLGEWD